MLDGIVSVNKKPGFNRERRDRKGNKENSAKLMDFKRRKEKKERSLSRKYRIR